MNINSVNSMVRPPSVSQGDSGTFPGQGLGREVAKSETVSVKAATAQNQLPNPEQVKQAIVDINNVIKSMSSNVEFSIDKETQERVVKVINKHSGEVIRQMPTEEMLNIAKEINKLQGLIIRQTV